jgi:mannose-6-phosphate isomerase-like protein (cupin superfamily)
VDTARPRFRIARGEDRFGAHRGVGIGTLTIKVSTADSDGALLVCEIAHHAEGGPPRHVHHNQDEWFHVIEGRYVIEIGGELFRLSPGDSAFGPRGVPHGWAHMGKEPGRITFVSAPAGRLEAFFLEITKVNAMAPQEPAFWPPFDLALAGPPLELSD